MFGLIGIGAMVVPWQTLPDMGYSYWTGGAAMAGLLFFAFAPRAIWSRFWKAGALLACTGLIFTTVQFTRSIARSTDPVLLVGDVLWTAVYIAMLIDAVRSRPATGRHDKRSEQ